MRTQPPATSPGIQIGIADLVMSNINGQRDAQRVIYSIRQGCAPADALHDAFELVRSVGDAVRLQGFARELQKHIERSRGISE